MLFCKRWNCWNHQVVCAPLHFRQVLGTTIAFCVPWRLQGVGLAKLWFPFLSVYLHLREFECTMCSKFGSILIPYVLSVFICWGSDVRLVAAAATGTAATGTAHTADTGTHCAAWRVGEVLWRDSMREQRREWWKLHNKAARYSPFTYVHLFLRDSMRMRTVAVFLFFPKTWWRSFCLKQLRKWWMPTMCHRYH